MENVKHLLQMDTVYRTHLRRCRSFICVFWILWLIRHARHDGHAVDDFRIHHTENHGNMGNNQEAADSIKWISFFFIGFIPEQDTDFHECDRQRNRTPLNRTHCHNVDPRMPTICGGQWNHCVKQQVEEYSVKWKPAKRPTILFKVLRPPDFTLSKIMKNSEIVSVSEQITGMAMKMIRFQG